MTLVVVGSVGLDDIETPHGKVESVVGGTAVYASLAASLFTEVRVAANRKRRFVHESDRIEHGRGKRVEAPHRIGASDARAQRPSPFVVLEPDVSRSVMASSLAHRRARPACQWYGGKNIYSSTLRSRSAFVTTETELRLMAAAAIIGLRSRPNSGNSTPAANGTPSAL